MHFLIVALLGAIPRAFQLPHHASRDTSGASRIPALRAAHYERASPPAAGSSLMPAGLLGSSHLQTAKTLLFVCSRSGLRNAPTKVSRAKLCPPDVTLVQTVEYPDSVAVTY